MNQAGENNPAYVHGHTNGGKFSPTYHSWAGMISRCGNPNIQSAKYYAEKGVTVCGRWRSFANFLADMGERPEGTTLDRKDNDGNYEPGNCRWATIVEQNRNSSQVVWVELDGVRKRLVEWCEELGMSINTVRARVKFHGYTYERALTTPPKHNPGTAAVWKPKRK